MPILTIEGPPIQDVDRKRQLAKELTDAAVRAYGLPIETIVVMIKENAAENVAVGGRLVADRR